jgi:hypothetical protein
MPCPLAAAIPALTAVGRGGHAVQSSVKPQPNAHRGFRVRFSQSLILSHVLIIAGVLNLSGLAFRGSLDSAGTVVGLPQPWARKGVFRHLRRSARAYRKGA